MKRKPTRPDLLERFVSLALSGKYFEKENGLPRNLIAQMRQGSYSGEKASATVAKLEAAIEAAERAKAKPTKDSSKKPRGAVEAPRAQGRPREKVADDVEEELLGKIRGAGKPEEWDELLRYVMELAAIGKVSSAFASYANDAISNGRQLAKAKSEEEERARAGETMTIEIRYVNAEWRHKGEAP